MVEVIEMDFRKKVAAVKINGIVVRPRQCRIVWSERLGDHRCMHCGGCVAICTQQILQFRRNQLVWDWQKCIGCGICIEVCPEGILREEK